MPRGWILILCSIVAHIAGYFGPGEYWHVLFFLFSLLKFICNLILYAIYVRGSKTLHISMSSVCLHRWVQAFGSIERSITLFDVIIVLCISRFSDAKFMHVFKMIAGVCVD